VDLGGGCDRSPEVSPTTETSDFESGFADRLALSEEAQNLLFRHARTASSFSDEPISDDQVKAIYDLAKWAPTSMNNQPLGAWMDRLPRLDLDEVVSTV
jgi:hypothetical protein